MTGVYQPRHNFFTTLTSGYVASKERQRQADALAAQQEQQRQLNQLMGGALTGNKDAFTQLAMMSPESAMAVQAHQQKMAAPGGGMNQQQQLGAREQANKSMQSMLSTIAMLPKEQQAQAMQDAAAEHQSVYGQFSNFPTEIGEREERLFGRIQDRNQATADKMAKEAATKRADVYRNKFSQAYEPLSKVRSSVSMISGLIDRAIENDSGISDQAAIIGIMKALDPGSVVSTAEGQTIASSESLPSQFVTGINKMLTGEKLSNELRQDIMNTANAILQQKELAFFSQVQPYIEAARNQEGLDVATFMGDTLAADYEAWEKAGGGLGIKTYEESKKQQPADYVEFVKQQADKIAGTGQTSTDELSNEELLQKYGVR